MPDITAARPVPGAPIESAWGGQVHDQVEGIQTGTVSIAKPSGVNVGGSAVVVFPRPYASPPVVVCASTQSGVCVATVNGITATQATLFVQRIDQIGTATTQIVNWVAIGVPA